MSDRLTKGRVSRVEVIGNATLYLGDCRDVLHAIQPPFCVVTDPPYGIRGGTGGDARDFAKGAYEASWDDTPEYIATVVAPVIRQCIERAVAVAVTPGIRCLNHYPLARDMGCFWTPAAATHGPWGMTCFQPILYYGKDHRAGKGAWPTGKSMTEAAEKNGHPCPKPYKAWRWLIAKVAHPGMTVVDPFMGSGTSGAVCADLGLPFVGIEVEPIYFDIACTRIKAVQDQGRLFA
jgi:site-specific DNA-methyltransferase (adenine-specific)